MSVPMFPAGRHLLEFSRDREDDVLLFTTATRIWPTNNSSERRLRPTKTYPDAIRPDLASSLNNLSTSLADLGRREDALTVIEQAARVYRELAARWPDAYSTGWNNRCDLLTGSSTVKATHPRGN